MDNKEFSIRSEACNPYYHLSQYTRIPPCVISLAGVFSARSDSVCHQNSCLEPLRWAQYGQQPLHDLTLIIIVP